MERAKPENGWGSLIRGTGRRNAPQFPVDWYSHVARKPMQNRFLSARLAIVGIIEHSG
jgi:hypothetical protein